MYLKHKDSKIKSKKMKNIHYANTNQTKLVRLISMTQNKLKGKKTTICNENDSKTIKGSVHQENITI